MNGIGMSLSKICAQFDFFVSFVTNLYLSVTIMSTVSQNCRHSLLVTNIYYNLVGKMYFPISIMDIRLFNFFCTYYYVI